MKLIDKDALVAEIDRRIKRFREEKDSVSIVKTNTYKGFLSFLETLEVKEVKTWHLQEKEDIYDAVKDWDPYTFACIMKDGTIQKFTGCLDEDCDGHVNVHIDGTNDDYDNVDDIVKWIEFT